MHDDYPLAPEKLVIPHDILSDYCKKLVDKNEIKFGDVKKLIGILGKKTNYVLYCKNLQLHFSLGTKVAKIHRVHKIHKFHLSSPTGWKNILILTLKKEQIWERFFKLMINSVYDKTMENLRKRIILVNNEKDFLK